MCFFVYYTVPTASMWPVRTGCTATGTKIHIVDPHSTPHLKLVKKKIWKHSHCCSDECIYLQTYPNSKELNEKPLTKNLTTAHSEDQTYQWFMLLFTKLASVKRGQLQTSYSASAYLICRPETIWRAKQDSSLLDFIQEKCVLTTPTESSSSDPTVCTGGQAATN